MSIKSGYVSIVGKPNVGKSTLMNTLLGQKLSITTKKPQTTRKKILGILSTDDYQVIFLDTPGILNPDYLLQQRMLEYVYSSAKDSDIILLMIDVSKEKSASTSLQDERVAKILSYKKSKKILVLNKIDLTTQTVVDKLISEFGAKKVFDKIIPVSATLRSNTQSVIDAIIEFLPVHPKYFPDDQLSDDNERFFVSEIIREKIFEQYYEEVPFSTEVLIEEFKEREQNKDYIRAAIVVERESQKPIIIGAKGASIKKLGQTSRKAVEEFLQHEVFLELLVKVREKWRTNPNMLKNFGYIKSDE